MKNTQYTVSQLLHIAKVWFEEVFWDFSFWCIAEVVSVKQYAKVIFIECIEYTVEGEVAAKCTISLFNKAVLYSFFWVTNLDDKSIAGQKILFNGHFSLYGDKLSIIADEISPQFTLWQVQQNQQHIRETLLKEWIWSLNKQKDIGHPPYNLAIISARQAAGLEDFLQTLKDSNIQYSSTIYDAVVHWNGAKESVYAQLLHIKNLLETWKQYDAVVIMRGGGDTAGILWQNDIDIARSICSMWVPVIVAIWHTKDISILEEISYLFAKTPTAAAQFFIDKTAEYNHMLVSLYEGINQAIAQKMQQYIYDIQKTFSLLTTTYQHRVLQLQEDVSSTYKLIQTYHPDNILKQGYAVIRQRDKILAKDTLPMPGEKIEIETVSLQIYATVDSIATKE